MFYFLQYSHEERKRLIQLQNLREEKINLNPSIALNVNVVPKDVESPDRAECSQEVKSLRIRLTIMFYISYKNFFFNFNVQLVGFLKNLLRII